MEKKSHFDKPTPSYSHIHKAEQKHNGKKYTELNIRTYVKVAYFLNNCGLRLNMKSCYFFQRHSKIYAVPQCT